MHFFLLLLVAILFQLVRLISLPSSKEYSQYIIFCPKIYKRRRLIIIMQLAYLALKTKIGKLKLVTAALEGLNEIVDFHEVYGRYDVLVLVELESMEELKTFIQNKIMIVDGLSGCETMIVRD